MVGSSAPPPTEFHQSGALRESIPSFVWGFSEILPGESGGSLALLNLFPWPGRGEGEPLSIKRGVWRAEPPRIKRGRGPLFPGDRSPPE